MPVLRLVDVTPDTLTLPRKPCVYALLWVRSGKPVSIPRVLAVDPKGILYIASTENLKRRVASILLKHLQAARQGSRPQGRMHAFVIALQYTGMIDKVREEELQLAYKQYPDILTAARVERAVLAAYMKRYGEPPPMNLYLSKKHLLTQPLQPDPELLEALGLPRATQEPASRP